MNMRARALSGIQRLSPSEILCTSALAVLMVGSGCSKGGAPDADPNCKKVADFSSSMLGDGQLPRELYAELKHSGGMARIGMPLDGAMGIYSGTRALTKCDLPGVYSVDRISLISAGGQQIATAARMGAGFRVTYQNGQVADVTGAAVANTAVSFSPVGAMPSLRLQAVTISGGTMPKVGDRVTGQIALTDDECGIAQSKWWLTGAAMPGGAAISETSVIQGPQGTFDLRVPPTVSAGQYVVEGEVTLKKGGRLIRVRRQVEADPQYKLFDGVMFSSTDVAVLRVTAGEGTDIDKTPPQPLLFEASPLSPKRCEPVNFSLRLSDDRGLPPMQQTKLYVGTQEQPRMLWTMLMGGGEGLQGSLILPSDAPSGVYYAYPEKLRDAAGNEGVGELTTGRVTLVANGLRSTPVMAGTFVLPAMALPGLGADMSMPDLSAPGDMAAGQLPAALGGISATPASITKEGDNVTVTMTWNDLAMILK